MTNLPTTRSYGIARPLGCRPRPPDAPQHFQPLDDAIPLMPETAWRDTDNTHLLWDLMDQGQTGACNACAATMALEGNREQEGLPRVALSWGNLYGQINYQKDEGSVLEHAHEALHDHGVTDSATIPRDEWRAENWPPDWRTNAQKHGLLENWTAPTFAHLATAIITGWFIDCGIPIGPQFTPNDEGIIPRWRGPIRGYHALCACGLRLHAGTWHIRVKNSWGQWGYQRNGTCWVPRNYFFNDFADAFAPRVTTYSRRKENHERRTPA